MVSQLSWTLGFGMNKVGDQLTQYLGGWGAGSLCENPAPLNSSPWWV